MILSENMNKVLESMAQGAIYSQGEMRDMVKYWTSEVEFMEECVNPESMCVDCTEELKMVNDLCEACDKLKEDSIRGVEYEHKNEGNSDE